LKDGDCVGVAKDRNDRHLNELPPGASLNLGDFGLDQNRLKEGRPSSGHVVVEGFGLYGNIRRQCLKRDLIDDAMNTQINQTRSE
jgi:hypothetical protein